MNIALWILQIIIAAFFLTVGLIKVVLTKKRLAKVFDWIDDFSQNKIKIIGGFETLGALGLFLPGVYSLGYLVIPLSAAGLAIIMILAAITHYNRSETKEMSLTIGIFVLLGFVIIGRFAF